MAIASLLFVCIGIAMAREGATLAWLGVGFFGLCFAVAVVSMLPNASYLRLTEDGFTMCSLYRSQTFRWQDVTAFAVGRVLSHRMVMFSFKPSDRRARRTRSLNAWLSGHEAALPDSYGLTHEDLADLLNTYRAMSIGG